MAGSRNSTETPPLHGSQLSEEERTLVLALRALQMASHAVTTHRAATADIFQMLQRRLGDLSPDEARVVHVYRSGGSIAITPDEYNLLAQDNMTSSERAVNKAAGYAVDEDTMDNKNTKRLKQVYGDIGERVDKLAEASEKRTERLRQLQDLALNSIRETEDSIRETEEFLGVKFDR
jgi:hypothetical protein